MQSLYDSMDFVNSHCFDRKLQIAMIQSRYTFTFETESGRMFIMNYLTGALDEIEPLERPELELRMREANWEGYHLAPYMLERGYLFSSVEEEESMIQDKFLEFQDEYDRTAIQLIFSTTYACNFSCVYCFQESYREDSKILTPEIVDAFFSYVERRFGKERVRPYVTLFGGEPLLGAERYKKNLIYMLEKAKEHDIAICIVTNGYELSNYVPEFQRIGVRIREIQVSMDGSPEMQNRRRPTAGGKPTFDRVSEGIDTALRAGYRINLRMIVDRDNLESLVDLANHAQQMGWMDYPESMFETTIGRNYELHTCQPKANLYDRLTLWQDFVRVAKKHPILAKFHRPQFHGMRYLKENGSLPMPIFDGCPAGKKEWAFDLNGDIYGCTASVGVKKYRLGNIFEEKEAPALPFACTDMPDRACSEEFRQELMQPIASPEPLPGPAEQAIQWASRDVLSIDQCRQCPVSLSCGGGCGVLAANRTGKILSTDCRPVRELVALGVDYYEIG
jgi:uncharacterized protein